MSTNDTEKQIKKRRLRWIPKFIRHDFWRKVCAFFFALIVMYYVYPRSDEETDNYLIHQVRVRLLPKDGYLLKYSNPDFVNIVFRGSKKMLAEMKPEDLVFFVPVGEQEWTEKKVLLKPEHLTFLKVRPANLRMLKVEPEVIELKMDKIKTKEFPISAVYNEEELPQGYYVQSVSFPEGGKVPVRGDDSVLKQLKMINTKPISLAHHIAAFTTSVELDKPAGLACIDQVTVEVRISRFNSKTFMGLPVRVLLSPDQLGKFVVKLGRPEADVQLSGKKEVIDALGIGSVRPYLDLTGLRQDHVGKEMTVPLQCAAGNPDAGIKLLTDDKIKVTLFSVSHQEAPKDDIKNEISL